MQYEKATIKKAVKKYKTVKHGVKESVSVNINLGAKSDFNDGDKVVILPVSDFNKVSDVNVDDLKKSIAEKDETITALNDKITKLNDEIDDLKALLSDKDLTINDYEKKIVILDNVDISDLQEKAKELDKSKNVIILQQNQIIEYKDLVNYYKETSNAYKNQNVLSKLTGKDVTADIDKPKLILIDYSGNITNPDNDDDNS